MKKDFFILWLAGLVGAVAILPYAFTLQHEILAKAGPPLPIIILASIAQTAVLLAIAVFFGLKLAARLKLSVLKLFDSNITVKEKLTSFAVLTISMGIATAVLITLGDSLFGLYLPNLAVANSQVAMWKTLLASIYGGVVEEILLRLFVMSFFAWILGKMFRQTEIIKNNWIMWMAIIVASVLFGLGHLPITSSLTAITPLVVLRAIVLNGIGGIVFGWLYWKKGLEYAIAAHFSADVVLLSLLPALLK